jgi:hypothetical protein
MDPIEATAAWPRHPATITAYMDHLRRDIEDRTWDAHYGHPRYQPEFDGSIRLFISIPQWIFALIGTPVNRYQRADWPLLTAL